MKSIFLFSFGSLITPIFKILALFINFKFCHLHSTRIGHLTINFDVALLSVPKHTIILFSHDNNVANKYILNFFKKQKKVLFLSIFKYFYFSISHINPSSNLIINWNKFQPKFSLHLKNESRIIFPYNTKKKLEKILNKYQINKEFVGLHSRNELYLKRNMIHDNNFHDFRNFDFNDYKLAIKYLDNKNISLIKLGETFVEENINSTNPKIFTSLDFESNQEIDYLLNTHAKYNVIGNSGVSGISSIHRKKIIYINLIPLNLNNLSYCSPGSLILPKKIFNKQKGRFLTFKENTEIELSIHQEIDPYKKYDLSVVNNSPKEILDTIIEMEEKLLDNSSDDSIRLNDLFWKNITDNNQKKISYLKNDLKLFISTSFLKNNQNLF